jgi:tRNA(Ile)-lysidine synthase
MALLHVLAHLRDRLRIEVTAHGVDHGLREEAASELELARALARRCGVEFGSSRVSVRPGGNLQARAREARFRVLGQVASRIGAEAIATAHHADDRAETVLLRLLRGAGPTGLAVLPPRDGNLIRPMIRARRASVLAHLERHAIQFASDPSNQDRRFARVRVRLDAIPALEVLSPRLVEHLCDLADRLRDASPPLVLVADGELLPLGRAQQEQVRQLLGRRARGARVLLPGGRELRLADGAAVRLSSSSCGKGLPKR